MSSTLYEVGHEPRYEMDKKSLFSAFYYASPIDTVHYGLMHINKIERHEKDSGYYYITGRGVLGERIHLVIYVK